jgi:hypothetical protein
MLRVPILLSVLLASLVAGACRPDSPPEGDALRDIALEYLELELAMSVHDSHHVDAYFGPDSIRQAAVDNQLSPGEIHDRAGVLAERLDRRLDGEVESLVRARIQGLIARLDALLTRIAILEGEHLAFDEESRRLFGAEAPDHEASHFDAILAEIDRLLPGDGPLPKRVNDFQEQFVIPEQRLSKVFEAAIAECRRRTLEHIDLPESESFRVEYVTGKPWSGYNWYEGDATSLIQINTELPVFIGRAVDLGCHEGYPGHHTYNALLESRLVRELGWLEFTLYPLFSPQSLIAEGSGNYGIELAFPGDERVEFEKRVLFPLAGLDIENAERYYALAELLEQLDYAGNEAARSYLNGEMDRETAVQWLVDYTLASPERARQRVDFFDTYRSYVINYNLGEDLVRDYVEHGATTADERWQRFRTLLASPMLPSDLR